MTFSSEAFERTQKLFNGPIPPPPGGLFSNPLMSWFSMLVKLCHVYFDIYLNIVWHILCWPIWILRLLQFFEVPSFTGPVTTKILSPSRDLSTSVLLAILLYVMSLYDRFFLQRMEKFEERIVGEERSWSLRTSAWAGFWRRYFTFSKSSVFYQDFLEAWHRWFDPCSIAQAQH